MWFSKKRPKSYEKDRLPVHIGIIMDGNGRWAKKRGLPRTYGHREGAKTFEKIVESAANIGIKVLTFYAFSTENWERPQEEVQTLMELFLEYLDKAMESLGGKNIRVKVIGDTSRLSGQLQAGIRRLEAQTADNTTLLVNLAINYGGRDEIVAAAQKAAKLAVDGAIAPEAIDAGLLSSLLYTAGCPDPDLIIRPSGEQRLSNFLIWQAAYSEFCFLDVLWPDFTEQDLIEAICIYQGRSRRFGKL